MDEVVKKWTRPGRVRMSVDCCGCGELTPFERSPSCEFCGRTLCEACDWVGNGICETCRRMAALERRTPCTN